MSELKKDIRKWARKEFDALPMRKWNEDIGLFDSLVILPLRGNHDSGWRMMEFVAVRDNVPVCRMGGCSDVIHIDGIGGQGKFPDSAPTITDHHSWSIDCLPKSGLLRLFCSNADLRVGVDISSFDVYGIKPAKPTK